MTTCTNIIVASTTKIPTFQTWTSVPDSLASKGQWLKRSRRLKPGEEPVARWIKTSPQDPTNPFFALAGGDNTYYADDDFALVIDTEVPLFHISQTEPGRFQPRTLAYMAYEDIVFESARRDSYIVWDFEKESWQTRNAYENAYEYWQRGLLSTDIIRRHLNQREIIGIKGGPKTRVVALDHDFHGRDREVFLEQAELLLGRLNGNGWHYQVARDDIEGMHYLLVFNGPLDLINVRGTLRRALQNLDQQHPALAKRAKAAGMKTLADLEIYPHPDQGLRLPLCRGRQMLLDRPLPLVTYRKRTVQDVVAYIDWLNDPKRHYMSKQELLDLLYMNLAPSKTSGPRKALRTKIEEPQRSSVLPDNPTELGSLKNCCRQKITGYLNGTFNPPNSLNKVIAVSARIMLFQGVRQGDAVDVLRQYIRGERFRIVGIKRRVGNWP